MSDELLNAADEVLRAYDVTSSRVRVTEAEWDDLHITLAALRKIVKRDELPRRLEKARLTLEAIAMDASRFEECEYITRASLAAINAIDMRPEEEDDDLPSLE